MVLLPPVPPPEPQPMPGMSPVLTADCGPIPPENPPDVMLFNAAPAAPNRAVIPCGAGAVARLGDQTYRKVIDSPAGSRGTYTPKRRYAEVQRHRVCDVRDRELQVVFGIRNVGPATTERVMIEVHFTAVAQRADVYILNQCTVGAQFQFAGAISRKRRII